MKNLNVKKDKYKLICSLALTMILPSSAVADEGLSVSYSYAGDMVKLINPTYWDYDYNTVTIDTANTHIIMTNEEFEEILNTSEDKIIINDGGSIIEYDKSSLIEASLNAEEIYSPNKDIITKIFLNGGVTIIVLGAILLNIYFGKKDKNKVLN